MSCTSLHHIEMCLGDIKETLSLFTSKLGFRVVALRDTATCSQKVLRQQNSVIVLTQRKSAIGQPHGRCDPEEGEHFTVFCCENRHIIDSVFNSALLVKNVEQVTKRVEEMGGRVIRKPTVVVDSLGKVTYSIIATGFGNCVHTLINKTEYRGNFLPGFTDNDPQEPEPKVGPNEYTQSPLTTHVDHLAYVCREGESPEFLAWYEHVFGMRRFLVNREDDIEKGVEIRDMVGMRLRALEYWRCSETGLFVPAQGDSSLKIVVAEPITSITPNHVSNFLTQHQGPGLQHVAFHAPLLLHSVLHLKGRGVPFRQPPPQYYSHEGKTAELEQVGLGPDASLLQEAGVLLDTEADPHDTSLDGSGPERYLLQIFSEPIFERDSFFFELIYRAGALGFGVGNITSLARSIALQQRAQQLLLQQ